MNEEETRYIHQSTKYSFTIELKNSQQILLDMNGVIILASYLFYVEQPTYAYVTLYITKLLGLRSSWD